jgi:hypothetical protein
VKRAAKSIFWFSFWVSGCGFVLLLFPQSLLDLLAIDRSAGVVARIFGMVLLALGFYYFMAGRHGHMTDFYRWTTYTRPAAFLLGMVFVVTHQIKVLLLAFLGVDLLGALWTFLALRRDMGVQEKRKERK